VFKTSTKKPLAWLSKRVDQYVLELAIPEGEPLGMSDIALLIQLSHRNRSFSVHNCSWRYQHR
jgi:hypothetical protein